MSEKRPLDRALVALVLAIAMFDAGCGKAAAPKGNLSANTLSPNSGAGASASPTCASVSEDLGTSGFVTANDDDILGTYQGSITGTTSSGASQTQTYSLFFNLLPIGQATYPAFTFVSSGPWGNWNSTTCVMPTPLSIAGESIFTFQTPINFLSGIGGTAYPNTALSMTLAIDANSNLDMNNSQIDLLNCPSATQCNTTNDVPSIWLMQNFNKTN